MSFGPSRSIKLARAMLILKCDGQLTAREVGFAAAMSSNQKDSNLAVLLLIRRPKKQNLRAPKSRKLLWETTCLMKRVSTRRNRVHRQVHPRD